MYKIAVLLTCYNRKAKTIKALDSLLYAEKYYNENNEKEIELIVYFTDDGCTDGTVDAVKHLLYRHELHIINSDGNAYWAGGMRMAWNEACTHGNYQYYLLINDDVVFKKDCFEDLMQTDEYCREHYGIGGCYTGFLASPLDHNKLTYGAEVYKKGIFSSTDLLKPTGKPQKCTMPNANILCVSNTVVESIGILSSDYIHGAADWDYGMRASKAGCPVLTTCGICGYCENDHDSRSLEYSKIKNMTIGERKQFLNRPTIHYTDGFVFFRKYNKIKYLVLKLGYYLNIYTPGIFYYFFVRRNHK